MFSLNAFLSNLLSIIYHFNALFTLFFSSHFAFHPSLSYLKARDTQRHTSFYIVRKIGRTLRTLSTRLTYGEYVLDVLRVRTRRTKSTLPTHKFAYLSLKTDILRLH